MRVGAGGGSPVGEGMTVGSCAVVGARMACSGGVGLGVGLVLLSGAASGVWGFSGEVNSELADREGFWVGRSAAEALGCQERDAGRMTARMLVRKNKNLYRPRNLSEAFILEGGKYIIKPMIRSFIF